MPPVSNGASSSATPSPAEVESFIRKAFKVARKPGYRGLHTVYSKLNEAMRTHWPGCNPVDLTKSLVAQGKLISHPAKGGAMIYLPEEPPNTKNGADDLLNKMGL